MRRLGLGLALLLVVTACGGGDGADLPGTTASTDTTVVGEAAVRILEAGDALIARWGDEGAFFVVAWAFDRGYTLPQVVEGAQRDLINADGSIESDTGTPVAPGRDPAGLLSVVEAFGGAPAPRFVLAAVSPLLLGWGIDESPPGATVRFLDTTLREIFEGAQARLREQRAAANLEAEFENRMATLTLLLARRGYSGKQILESAWLGTFDFRKPFGVVCWVITGEHGIVKPDLPPEDLLHEFSCPAASQAPLEPAADGSPSTGDGDAAAVPDPVDSAINGKYTGEVTIVVAIPYYDIVDSRIEIVISGGSNVEMTAEFTLWYEARLFNDAVVCTATIRTIYRGGGLVETAGIQTDLTPESNEILSVEGTGCGVDEPYIETTIEQDIESAFAREGAVVFTGTAADGTITGSFTAADGTITGSFGDEHLSVSASRE